jgi:apolipoprotein N-acyltransferase
MPKSMPSLVALLGGALLSAALPPIGLWPLALALLPLFVLVARAPHARAGFWLGFLFGLGFFGLHLLWLPISFAELFGPAAWLLYPPLVLVLGLMWGLVTFLGRGLGGYGAGALALLPALWVLTEWARSQGPFAFPWGFVGYAWVGTPIAQAADLAGVYGLGLLTLVAVSLAASLFVPRRSRYGGQLTQPRLWPLPLALSLLLAAAFYGGERLSTTLPPTTETALLVQGNTNPLYRVAGEEDDLVHYARLTASALAELGNLALFDSSLPGASLLASSAPGLPDLVIWPEGAVLSLDLSREGAAAAEARSLIQASSQGLPVITGGGAFVGNQGFNSAFSLVGEQVVDRYDKAYLVPFGEYFPWQGPLHFLYDVVFRTFGLPFLDSRAAGEDIRPIASAGLLAGVYICYESVFPQVPRLMAREGAQVLSNISNDAWYGQGLGPAQHFLMGSLRAIETRRYILRAGNDGITAVIDPLGRVVQELPRGIEGTLLVGYSLRDDLTPYVRYGDRLIGALLLYALGVVAVRRGLA